MRVRNTRKMDLFSQVGCFRRDEVAQSLSVTALTYQAADDDAPTKFVAAHGGAIMGVSGGFQADDTSGGIDAGTATAQVYLNGTAVGETVVFTATKAVQAVMFKNRVPFSKGDRIELRLSSDSSFRPNATNNFHGWIGVNWNIVVSKAVKTSATPT